MAGGEAEQTERREAEERLRGKEDEELRGGWTDGGAGSRTASRLSQTRVRHRNPISSFATLTEKRRRRRFLHTATEAVSE